MAKIKTANFLPETFRTDANKKFLNATLDQLVSKPDIRNINGYVGRKFAPTFKSTDNYIPEPTAQRQNYQLEASVVVDDPITGENQFYASYVDTLQQLKYYGALTDNQTRLFTTESYSYDGLFDFDKFVNFNQYYWLEDGPKTVNVFASDIPTQQTFIVTRDAATGTYRFDSTQGVENPNIQLAYGGTYKFIVNQPGFPFWIQAAPGVSGTKTNQTKVSSRDVMGVTNNGIDVGTVTFKVPLPTAQDFYIRMTLAGTADLSTTLKYSQVQGKPLSSIIASNENGFDGVFTVSQINLKSLIFVNEDLDDASWTVDSTTVPVANRRNAWQISLSNDADPIVTLNPLLQAFTIGALQKVFVRGGLTRAESMYFLPNDYLSLNIFQKVPDITAPLSTLYYQDGIGASFVGEFSLLNADESVVDVENQILGSKGYKSPNGVTFTNGLKVKFDATATPASYQNKTYYVEGVGTGIKLIDTTSLINPESFATNGLATQDYITINRSSIDSNPWSRSNRWFHIDIINLSAAYNNETPVLDQNLRASRPIIEFESDIQLFNYGRKAVAPIDLINFSVTDSKNTVELQPAGYSLDGVVLEDGMRIVFANDFDSTVRDKIFVVNIVYIATLSGNVINLVPADDYDIAANNNLVILDGPYKGLQYYFDGATWHIGQQKTAVNQSPLFDIIDSNGTSIGAYTDSTFAGTKIFSYKVGTGANDPILNFPLSYRNFNQIGDIQFDNNFDSDTFDFTDGDGNSQTAININSVGWLQQNSSLTSSVIRNSWTTNVEQEKQFQVISGIYDGNNSYFKIDITNSTEATVPYFRVYRNALQITGWEIITVGVISYVHITDASLTTGDQIDILIYNSEQISELGYYEVPKSLDFNSQNTNFETLTLGQLRNHVSTMVANSNQIVGNFPGDSNLRDLSIKSQGGSILQHASPAMYTPLMLIDPQGNFMDGLDLARREYSKIKNKIIELSARTPGLDFTNIPALLDTLLKTINAVKNKSFAWYYSDMVPYGDIKNTITYTVESSEIVDYELTNIFSDTTLSNLAVLVYLNNVQLVKGQDYEFDKNRAGVKLSVPLTVGDTITINEYNDTDGNYIPETPTKLGLYPKFAPNKFYDTSYTTPIYAIQGHDGSITPAFGDYRDDLLLEFEKRIYNNIKVDTAKNTFDIYNYLPGKFRTTEYSNSEFTQLLTDSFLKWVGANRVDYITNSTFVASNEFTWNYSKFVDVVDGSRLPGYWRAVFKYFYDTDRPHSHPWEMIGLTEQPTWWEARYGAAPYTNGNMVLWDDMAAGVNWNNGASFVDERFIRPGLQNVIPVSATGTLLAPAEFLVKNFNSRDASADFKIGDQGPVETAWRRSSDFPFAMQQALAMAKPGFYFGTLFNINDYYKNTELNQYISASTLQRITPTTIAVNGNTSLVDGSILRSASYTNWISDNLRQLGIDPNSYQYLSIVKLNLSYRMAGFTDQSFMQVIAEQSSPTSTNAGVVIPNESYRIHAHKSTPTSVTTYSAVIIERTGNGYTVSGYDTTAPYFTIIPSLTNGKSYAITVLQDTAVIYQDYQKYKVTIPYGYEFTSRQQVVDFLVSYQRYLRGVGFQFNDTDPDLGVQRDWFLSVKEFMTWAQQGWNASSVIVLSPVLNKITLNTTIGVVDKIENQPNKSCVLNTSYNFVKYSQMSVSRENFDNGNTFTLTANDGQTLALVKLAVVEYEHVMIFDNVDIFNDVIYVPELGNRQYRLKLVGKKTGVWTGALNPPGFVFNSTTVEDWQQGRDYLMGTLVRYKGINYTALSNLPATTTFNPTQWAQLTANEIKTGLLPNFSYNAEKFNRFNDVDDPEVLGNFDLYSDSAIGFQPRQYLTNFGIDTVTQAKFYQGYIRQKGTMNAINAFTATGVNGVTSDINVYEEWAMRVGEYGALDNNRSVDLILTEGTFNGDPVSFTLLPNNGSSITGVIGVQPSQLYKTRGDYTPNIYLNRDAASNYKNDVQTAGYVNINDVTITEFDMSGDLSDLNTKIDLVGVGSTLWVAKDLTNDWNVYRINEANVSVKNVSYSVDNVGVITTTRPHKLAYGDIVLVKSFDVRVDAFYRVYNIVDAYNFSVVFIGQAADQIKQAVNIAGTGALFKLQSARIKTNTDLNTLTPLHGWKDGDKLWVDRDATTGGWAVYNKTTPWTGNVDFSNSSMKLDANSYVSSVGFGTVAAINASGTFALASSPSLNYGNVYAFVANVTNGNVLTLVSNLGAHTSGITKYGAALDTAGNVVYIGNPGDGTSQYGRVEIRKFDGDHTFTWSQTLSSPSLSNVGDLYGASVSASADGTWLYVAAPNAGNVYVYQGNATSYYTYANTITVGSSAAAQFGYNVKTTSTGNQVAISAPYQAVNGVSSAGTVYVFDRSIETFIASGTTYTTTYANTTTTSRVTVNGNVQTSGYTLVGTTLTFANAPTVGSVISVETNKIQLLETLTSTNPTSGGAFGSRTWIAGNDADVYVSSPGYTAPGYYSGIVHRYVNQGASYGTITGSNYSPVITAGDTIRINGVKVTFTSGNATTAASDINSAGIIGVTAIAEGYGALTITSNVTVPYQKLIIGPGTGNAMANLGLSVFTEVQSLQHPGTDDVSEYGQQIVSSPDSSTLVVTASGGATENSTTFDADTTIFDLANSFFIDTIQASGIVYIYQLVNASLSDNAVNDQYVLVETLQNAEVAAMDQFGYSVALNSNTLLVGAPGDSKNTTTDPISELTVAIPNAGTYYTYHSYSNGWEVYAQESDKVDIDSVSRMYLYNANTNVILTTLDYIDPAKGKVLGAAQDDLDFITAYDPAVYNSVGGIDGTPNLAYNLDYHWGKEQTTKTWWNTGVMRFVDYEQGDLTYRANNWGTTFPGSQIQICEWVASDMPPSAYPGPGTALYPDNSAYVVETTINPNTKLSTSTYYYWVINKNSVEEHSVHRNAITTIQDIIENPQAQDIPYAAVIRNDTISLHGIGNYLSGNSTVLHLDYDNIRNTHVIHSEYQLVQEGNASSPIPARIVDKLIDSLSGIDAHGNAVPDASLSAQTRVGLGINPNQTLFVDRTSALRNWVEYVNGVLIQTPIVSEFNINALYTSAAKPDTTTYDIEVATYAELGYIETSTLSVGYVALVSEDETQKGLWVTYTWNGAAWVLTDKQSFYTPFYWSKTDWYDSTYDSTVLPTYVVATAADVATLSLVVGNTVKVLNNGGGEFAVYRVNDDGSVSVVGIQNGTIQLNSNLYTTTVAANEIRIIFNAIKDYIFINTLSVYFNEMFFFLINYILTEQPSIDWAFKTSFIGILHKFRTLGQPASYSPDNQTYYETYINEVKPYRTSIREYKLDYQGNDEYYGDSTDFDIPSTYISSYGAYRSPNGEDPRDSIWLSTLPQYNQWYNNHTYGIGDVFVANAGSGFVTTPTVTVVGGGGTGANIQAIVNFTTGGIEGFNVISPGKGFTSTPTIFINGTGSGAVAYAKLVNHYQVDSLPTTQLDTFSNVTVYVGNIITQQNSGAYGTVYSSVNDGNVVALINTVGTFNTTDYIYSDAANLFTNASSVSSYTQFINNSYNTVRNFDTTLVFDRVSYSSNVIAWAPNITVANTSIVSYNGQAYEATANVYSSAILTMTGNISVSLGDYITQANTTANAEVIAINSNAQIITVGNLTTNFVHRNGNIFVNGVDSDVRPIAVNNVFDYTKYNLLNANSFTTAADRITAYYAPTATMPGRDLAQLMTGIDYPGVQVTGVEYAANTSVYNSDIIYTWSNTRAIYSSNVTIPTTTLTLSSSAVVYTSNVIVQEHTGATGVVYNTSTGDTITLVDVVGTFDTSDTYYISANSANLNVKTIGSSAYDQVTTQNLVDFTELGYAANQPLTLIDRDTSQEYKLNITEVDTWRIITSGNVPITSIGANLTLKYYDFNNPTYLDTIVQNTYTTSVATTEIDGGAYYDTYSSHAPEELVPGVTFDNLNMLVTTGLQNNTVWATYRVTQNMNGNAASTNTSLWPQYYGVSASHTTTLTQDLHITDSNIYVADAAKLSAPNVAKLIPGVVFINGEKITFWGVDLINNVLTQVRRAVDGTGAANVHVSGSQVVDTNVNFLIPGGNTVHTTTWLNQSPGAPKPIVDNLNQTIVDNLGNVLTTAGASVGAVTDGLGLEGSTTAQALYIKGLT